MSLRRADYFAGASLLLCTIVSVAWAQSYLWPVDGGIHKYSGTATIHFIEFMFSSTKGSLRFRFTDQYDTSLIPSVGWQHFIEYPDTTGLAKIGPDSDGPPTIFERLGLYVTRWPWHAGDDGGAGSMLSYFFEVHYWVLSLLSAILAAWQVRRARLLRKIDHSVCTKCGYDLRASPERCPECGTPRVQNNISSSHASAAPKD